MEIETAIPLSFSDFPDDVQLCVLSFLRPSDLSAFACTFKRFDSLCRRDQRLWFSLCDRRWGSKTLINKWGNGKISYRNLYRILHEYENLIGFWRRCGDSSAASPPLVFFEWGPFYITGSRISPSTNNGYAVVKKQLLWMIIASNGEPVISIRRGRRDSSSDYENVYGSPPERVFGSPPERVMTEIYQYFANRTSPSGNGASRRQRKREKKQGRMRKWESEHYVKIVNCCPKPSRPLQGLWKGICGDMSLDFYLVSYDDVGGIACRKVGDSIRPLAYYTPIFWTSNLTFIESPLSPEEDHIYNYRLHLRPPTEDQIHDHTSDVSRMLYINSSYDLVIPDLVGTTVNPRQVEGRIWQYRNGTFGFGFLR